MARVRGRLVGAVRDAAPRSRYQRALYVVSALLIVAGLLHGVVWLVDGGAWAGPVSWRKPMLFGVSVGLVGLNLGWVQGLLPRNRVLGWLSTWLMGVGSVVEVALITIQRWRGQPSHFNSATTMDGTIFNLMAGAVGLMVLGMVVLLGWSAVRLRGPAPAVVATFTGMTLLLVGSAIGGDLIKRGVAYVDAHDRVPSEVIIGAAGSGRLAHATALHAFQALAVLALLLGRSSLSARHRAGLMALAATGSVALATMVGAQAYAGRSMLEVSWPMGAGLAAATGMALVPFAVALLGPERAAR